MSLLALLIEPMNPGQGTAETSNPESPGGTGQKRSKKSRFPLLAKDLGIKRQKPLRHNLPCCSQAPQEETALCALTLPHPLFQSSSYPLSCASLQCTSIPLRGGFSRTGQGAIFHPPLPGARPRSEAAPGRCEQGSAPR